MAETPSFKEALSSTQGKIAIASGVAVVGWYWYRNRQAASAASSSGTTATTGLLGGSTADTGAADMSTGGSSGGYSGAFGDSAGATSSSPAGTGATNASWVQGAVSYLSSLGYDASTVASALGAYTQGQALTTSQQGIVSTALGALGPTPTGVPIATGTVAPTPSGGTTTVTSTPTGTNTPGGGSTGAPLPGPRTITVSKGETQKEIINAAGISYAEFTSLNPSLAAKGSKVTTGEKVKV